MASWARALLERRRSHMALVDGCAHVDETRHLLATLRVRQDESLTLMDDGLAWQEETLRHRDAPMACLGDVRAICHHEAAAAHQASAVPMTGLANQMLVLERTLLQVAPQGYCGGKGDHA